MTIPSPAANAPSFRESLKNRRRAAPRSLARQAFGGIMLALGLSVVVLLVAFNAYLRHAENEITATRITGVASEARQALEERVNLGLPLNFLAEAQGLIERIKGAGAGVAAVSVYGEAKDVLYSTERALIGARAPAAWLNEDGGLRWRNAVIWDGDALAVVAPLIDGANRPAGGVVVRAPQASSEARTIEAMSFAAAFAFGFWLLAGVLAWLACRLLLAAPEREIERACDVLIEFRRADVDRRPARATAQDAPQDAVPAAAGAEGTLAALRACRDEIRAIEETA